MFKSKKVLAIISIVILVIIGIVVCVFINKNSVKSPTPDSLFDLNTFDKKVLDNYVGRSQLEEKTSVNIKGVLAYATTSPDHRGENLFYGSRLIAKCEGYCQILPFNVNDKLLYLDMVLNKPITVNSENEVIIGENAGYYSVGDLFEINNQLVFTASTKSPSFAQSADIFVVYGSQKIKVADIMDLIYKDGVLSVYTEKDGVVTLYTKKV